MTPEPILQHLSLGDPSPFGQEGCSSRIPPHDVLRVYGADAYHSSSMEGDWQTNRAMDELAAHVARSEHCIDKTRDWEKWPNVVLAFPGREFLYIHRRTLVSYGPNRQAADDRLRWFSARFLAPAAQACPSFNLINGSYGMLRAETVDISPDCLPAEQELGLYYGEGFPSWHERFVATIVGRKSGLSLLEGPPGTGKTTYLRILMAKLKETHRFYYLPPSSLGCLVQPELVDFWVEEIERHGRCRRFVVVLEDCESALMTRDSDNRSQVSSILNITDGMFSDFLRTHVICTVNCPSSQLDPALLRPGRLVGHRHFGRLSHEAAGRLAVHLGKELEMEVDYSLAEIFAGPPVREEPVRLMGFAS